MTLRSRLNRLEKNEPPCSRISIHLLIRMQAIQKQGHAATLEERAWLEVAEARCANAPPDDPLLRLLAENEERKKTDPYFSKPNAIELRMMTMVWQSRFAGRASKEGRDVTPAEREQFVQLCREKGVDPEELVLSPAVKPPVVYGLRILPESLNGAHKSRSMKVAISEAWEA